MAKQNIYDNETFFEGYKKSSKDLKLLVICRCDIILLITDHLA